MRSTSQNIHWNPSPKWKCYIRLSFTTIEVEHVMCSTSQNTLRHPPPKLKSILVAYFCWQKRQSGSLKHENIVRYNSNWCNSPCMIYQGLIIGSIAKSHWKANIGGSPQDGQSETITAYFVSQQLVGYIWIELNWNNNWCEFVGKCHCFHWPEGFRGNCTQIDKI
jgi:hypothetical protein